MFVKNPEYFLAIVKERSISKAAERLYLSQPYLSQYLAKLESNLGVVLLDRSHTPLQLTEAGELFHAYLERQGYLDRQLESDLRDLQAQKRQNLHIGVSTWRGSTLLPDIQAVPRRPRDPSRGPCPPAGQPGRQQRHRLLSHAHPQRPDQSQLRAGDV